MSLLGAQDIACSENGKNAQQPKRKSLPDSLPERNHSGSEPGGIHNVACYLTRGKKGSMD